MKQSPDPLGADFGYVVEIAMIDYEALKRDIKQLLTTSAAWWPSDYNNYGRRMIPMASPGAGTHRIAYGHGGAGTATQRFAPVRSWWDNGNTNKSRRLLQPIKHKYGNVPSWADLIVFAFF